MRKVLTVTGVLLLGVAFNFAQTPLFEEDFESGTPNDDWGVYYTGEEAIQAVDMATAPIPLANGGSKIGYLQDVDVSYQGIALAMAGDTTDSNYTIEADVYCYTYHPEGSAYTGVVAYADSGRGVYYKLVADFDADNRFRFYSNIMEGFSYVFEVSFDATDVDTTEGWHRMAIKAETLPGGYPAFTCYYDGVLLGDGAYIDSTEYRITSGQYGVFSMQMDFSDGIAGYFDNIEVYGYEEDTSSVSIEPLADSEALPAAFVLSQNYPNPFNPSTTIEFSIFEGARVTLKVYNIQGRVIRTLWDSYLAPSHYSFAWDGRDYTGRQVPSGVYLYRLNSGAQSMTRRMLLLK
jgi:hypothetical protein